MPKTVVANGKTFTFNDDATPEQIGEGIDHYFSTQSQPAAPTQPVTQPSTVSNLAAGIRHGVTGGVVGAEQLISKGLGAIGAEGPAQFFKGLTESYPVQQQEFEAGPGQTIAGKSGEIGGNIAATLIPGLGAEKLALMAVKAPRAYRLLEKAIQTYGSTSKEARAALEALKTADKVKKVARGVGGAVVGGAAVGAVQPTENKLESTLVGGATSGAAHGILTGLTAGGRGLINQARRLGGSQAAEREAAGTIIAGNTAGDLAATPEQLGIQRTLGQETQDLGLLSAEKRLAAQDPSGFGAEIEARRQASNEMLIDKLRGIAPDQAPDVGSAINKAVEGKRGAITSIEKNMASKLPTPVNPAEASAQGAEVLKSSYKLDKATEKAAWEAVPKNIAAPISPLKEAFQNLSREVPMADRADLPLSQFRVVGRLAKREAEAAKGGRSYSIPMQEYKALYSKLKETARVARKNGEANKARLANETADLVMQHMDNTGLASEEYKIARQITSNLHSDFDVSKPISNIISKTEAGAQRGFDTELFDKVVRNPETVGQYIKAIKGDQNGLESLKGYIVSKALKEPKWAEKSQSIIANVPQAGDEILKQKALMQHVDDLSKVSSNFEKSIKAGPEKDFINGEPNRAMQNLFGSADGPKRVERLNRTLKNDQAAREGLQTLAVDEFLRRTVPSGGGVLSYAKTNKLVNENKKLLYTIFKKPEQRALIDALPQAVKQMESIRSATAVGGSHTAELAQGVVQGNRVLRHLMHLTGAYHGGLPNLALMGHTAAKTAAHARIMDIVKAGLLDPQLGRALATEATKKNVERVAGLYNKSLFERGIMATVQPAAAITSGAE